MKSIKLNALAYMGIRVLNIIFPILTGTYVARVLTLSILFCLFSCLLRPMESIVTDFVLLVM